MIILLGGLPGSGRGELSRKLSELTGFRRYEVKDKKLRRHFFDSSGLLHEYIIDPNSDEKILGIYKNILNDMPLISKMHPGIVLDDSLHRKIPREYLLSGLREYFQDVVFVWINCEAAFLKNELQRKEKMGEIKSADAAVRLREHMTAEMEVSTEAVFLNTFSHNDVVDLWQKIKSGAHQTTYHIQ